MDIDIKIEPKIEDEKLMFHFVPAIGQNEDIKITDSYRFIKNMIKEMMRGNEDKLEIGLVGNIETISVVLATILKSYSEHKDAELLNHLLYNDKRGFYEDPE